MIIDIYTYSTKDKGGTKDETKEKKKVDTVGLFEMFKFADSVDKLLILSGLVFAAVAGSMFPIMFFIFGDLTNAFALQGIISDEEFMELVVSFIWKMCSIGERSSVRSVYYDNVDFV